MNEKIESVMFGKSWVGIPGTLEKWTPNQAAHRLLSRPDSRACTVICAAVADMMNITPLEARGPAQDSFILHVPSRDKETIKIAMKDFLAKLEEA